MPFSPWRSRSSAFTFAFDSVPLVKFAKTDLVCSAKGDSAVILGTSGTFFPTSGIWRGTAGRVTWERAGLKPSLEQLRAQEEERVLALGWKASADGVLTRWCTEDCNPPRLYGGGRAEVFEVWCRQRPCGTIRATFHVIDKQGKAIEDVTATRTGLQGERLRLVVVSAKPQAARFALAQFSAQAMVF